MELSGCDKPVELAACVLLVLCDNTEVEVVRSPGFRTAAALVDTVVVAEEDRRVDVGASNVFVVMTGIVREEVRVEEVVAGLVVLAVAVSLAGFEVVNRGVVLVSVVVVAAMVVGTGTIID